jgi:hypothetical protein
MLAGLSTLDARSWGKNTQQQQQQQQQQQWHVKSKVHTDTIHNHFHQLGSVSECRVSLLAVPTA